MQQCCKDNVLHNRNSGKKKTFEFGNLTWEEVAKLQQRGCGIILYFWQNDIKPGKCVIKTIKSLSCF